MNANIEEIVNKLSKQYKFNAEEAMNFLNTKVEEASVTSNDSKTKLSPLEQARKNVALWQKKQDANKFKDDDAKNKHQAKLDKEKAKLAKLEQSASNEVKTVEVVKQTEEKSNKLITRMSPTLKNALLRVVLRNSGQTISDEDWKKSKKPDEFKNYVNSLSAEDQKAKGLDKHMEDFVANLQQPAAPAVVVEKVQEPSTKGPQVLTITQLKHIQNLSETETPGLYWDADKGRFVTGPEEDVDEDMLEMPPHKERSSSSSTAVERHVCYVVGDKTGRLYRCSEDEEGADVFAGYLGIGKYKNMAGPSA